MQQLQQMLFARTLRVKLPLLIKLLRDLVAQRLAHSSGGYILTGSGGYVAGTLLSPFVVPTVIVATVAVAGTAAVVVELSCAPRNHPEAISSVKRITAYFNNAVRVANTEAVVAREKAVDRIRELNEDAIVIRDGVFDKAKDANSRAIEVRDKYFAGVF